MNTILVMDSLLALAYGLHAFFESTPSWSLPGPGGDNVCSRADHVVPWEYGRTLAAHIQQVKSYWIIIVKIVNILTLLYFRSYM